MHLEPVAEWAAERGGPFLVSEARAAHFSRRCLSEAASGDKVLRSLGHGVLVSAALWEAADARGRHLLLVSGRLLQKDQRWVAARRSGAIVQGLPLLGDPPLKPQLLRDDEGGKASGRNRYERVATLEPGERTEVDGIATCELARIVFDLAREEDFRSALVVADGALRRGLELTELEAMMRTRPDWPGVLHVARLVRHATGLHETPLESLSWASCIELGIRAPEPQVQIYYEGRLLARVDGFWREQNTVGQADGQFKYAKRDDVVADKLQDESLEDVGLEVVRWGWTQALHPEGTLDERLLRAFERGRRQQLDPRVRFVPTTLEQSLAWTGLIAS